MSLSNPPATGGRQLVMAAAQALEARDRSLAARCIGQLIAQNPPLGDTWGSVARLASLIGEVTSATTAARRYMKVAPGDRDRRLFAAALLASHGQVEEAISVISPALQKAPDDAALRHFLGTCRAQLGQPEAALRELRRSLATQQTAALAVTWLTLADLKTFVAGDSDIAALQKAVAALHGIDDMQSAALYALGKALDDTGDVDGAFAAFERGAALLRRTRGNQADDGRAYADALIAGSTRAHQQGLPVSAVTSSRPIFVLGAPRSGSTLVEQMLASHSAVVGGGELNLFQRAAMGLGSQLPDDQARFAARPDAAETWSAIGETYLHLLDQRFGARGRVIDKTLSHTRMVGLIASILPEARFIWMRRHPVATGWSCFRTHFSEGLDWTWSQEQIGRYLRDEDRLHAHWTALLPGSILTVPYEGLVEAPGDWLPRILEHVGLAMEPATLEFQKTRRPIQTASVSQVRKPLYNSAVAGWKRYERHLQPMISAYSAGAPGHI